MILTVLSNIIPVVLYFHFLHVYFFPLRFCIRFTFNVHRWYCKRFVVWLWSLTTKTKHRHNLCLVLAVNDHNHFTQKEVFGPRTTKSQPIWIKFCIHLLFSAIHLWADSDRDRRVGGSRPNQNDYVFVILVTHPKSYIETTDRREKVDVRTGGIVKNSGIL